MGPFKTADVPLDRAGKGPPLVAEQFAFDQSGRQPTTIDGDQLLLVACAPGVDRFSEQALAHFSPNKSTLASVLATFSARSNSRAMIGLRLSTFAVGLLVWLIGDLPPPVCSLIQTSMI